VLLADAVQEERHLTVVFDHPVRLQKMHDIGEPICLVPHILAPDAEHRRVVRMFAIGASCNLLVIPERLTARVGPVGGCHPAIVFLHDTLVRAVVRRELDDRAIGEPRRELQYISDRCTTKAIQALILVPDDTEVASPLRELEEELFLNVVGILVLVYEDVADVLPRQVPMLGVSADCCR
jgi:hypothetical protein